jgi:hypothetical protein
MRRVALPKKKLNVIRDGEKTGEMVGVFHNLAGFIVENTPQKTDTEAYLSHSIREKLDARPEPESIDFEEAEIAFLNRRASISDRHEGGGRQMTAEDITNREVVEQEKRQAWISRGINILWAVIVASIATYVTIRVTLAEVQSQVRENREMLRALETREEQTAKTVRALELSDGGDRVRQEEIYRRLDRIDASNEKVMELLGQMMARRNTK